MKRLSIKKINKLLDVEKETGPNLYLAKDWQKGKIELSNRRHNSFEP